jgi:ABC transporter substrate binding protein
MQRRDFITLLGGAAVAWPVAARGQPSDRMRLIGVLMGGADTDNPEGQARLAAFLQVLQQLGWTDGRNVRDAGQIERAIAAFANSSNGGLIVTSSSLTFIHRDLIVTLAARYKLPAVYYRRLFATSGGLISYGSDVVGQYRRAAGYVDRILKGEKPAELPVQAPTKYELVINLKTAKALGLDVPPSLLARADEVIE